MSESERKYTQMHKKVSFINIITGGSLLSLMIREHSWQFPGTEPAIPTLAALKKQHWVSILTVFNHDRVLLKVIR